MLRRVALISSFAAISSAAFAADLPRRSPAYAPAPVLAYTTAANWTGFYAGVNAGATWSRFAQTEVIGVGAYPAFTAANIGAIQNAAATQSLKGTGFTGGLQLGYNWQINNVVVGVEGDINGNSGGSKTATTIGLYAAPAAPNTFTLTQAAKNNWTGTLRGRLGYSFGEALVYGTGGLAVGGVSLTRTFSDTNGPVLPQVATTSKTKVGYALGGGIEYALTRNWSIKGEYLYTDLGKVTTAGLVGPAATQHLMSGSESLRRHSIRMGVNYRF